MTDVAIVVPFVPHQIDLMERAIWLWGHRDFFPCDPAQEHRKHVDLVFQFTVCVCACVCMCVRVCFECVLACACMVHVFVSFFPPSLPLQLLTHPSVHAALL